MVQTIASATLEVSATAEQVNRDIDEIADISKNTAATTEEMYVTSFELAQSEHTLASEISFFKTERSGSSESRVKTLLATAKNQEPGIAGQE